MGQRHLGGEVVFSGLPADIETCEASLTGALGDKKLRTKSLTSQITIRRATPVKAA